MKGRNEEVTRLRKEKGEEALDLKSRLDGAEMEREDLRAWVGSLGKAKEALEGEVELLSWELREKGRESADCLLAAAEEVIGERKMVLL